jgi:hemerythrin-like domain-containing protein
MLLEHGEGGLPGDDGRLARIEGGRQRWPLVDSAGSIAAVARTYSKEDEVLFRMADEVIPADEQKRLLQEFENHEVKEMGAGAHEKFLKIAAELEGATG